MAKEMSLEEAMSPYSSHPTLTPESEKYLSKKWARLVQEVQRLKTEEENYTVIEGEVAKVYCHITNGRISKWNTVAEAVIGEHDAVCSEEK